MTMAEDFKASQRAYSDLMGHVESLMQDVRTAYYGLDLRVKQHVSEFEDLQEKVNKIAAYLKKKHPEDFGDKS